jgi:signal transduction histidine kinase
MPIVESTLAALPCDPRREAALAEHATSAAPAWLWSANGPRILWANAVGAAIFGAAKAGECAARRFDVKHPAATEIARLAATLPPPGQARLERLRGFGGSFGRPLTCLCSRVALTDGAAILLVSTEPAGPSLPLPERVSRLYEGREGTVVAFSPAGTLLYATPTARARLADASTPSALGIAGLAAQALAAGSASGTTPYGPVVVERLGRDASAVLVAQFESQSGADRAAANTARADGVVAPLAEPVAAPPPQAISDHASSHGRDEPAERRHPLRFVWQMDADGRFVVGSDEFIELLGPRTTATFGRLWSEVAAELKLDPENQVARAVATHATWSGITIPWPVDGEGERLPVELSGLPVFDRNRDFRGYRGFGVCRDLARINHLSRARRERPVGFTALPEAPATREEASVTTPRPEAPADADSAAGPPMAGPEVSAERRGSDAERSSHDDVPASANVVPFRAATAPEPSQPMLSPVERKAFRELAQELTARLQGVGEDLAGENGSDVSPADGDAHAADPAQALAAAAPASGEHAALYGEQMPAAARQPTPLFEPTLLDRIPLGILIYRHDGMRDTLLHANRYFLELSGYDSLDALAAIGGPDKLLAAPGADALAQTGSLQSLSIVSRDGMPRPVEGRLFTVPWGDGSALALILSKSDAEERRLSHALSLAAAQSEIRELKAHVEAFKKTEADMRATTREAQKAAAAKAEFVGKISHEIRTPLNAVTGFAEVIMAERFGPVGNDRYREYLKDIHAAGMQVVALLNDLLDLSKAETGQLDLSFANISLNELTRQCVGIMQPQASRARIIIRTSLTPGLPQVVADERSLRQIVFNLLSNSIKFTGPGGQVIVSTAFADSGEAVLRVRDTGVGMSEKDVAAALEPFRQTATTGSWGSAGSGLGLPLTKALAEANRAHFSIKSAPNAGTLVEVAFPPTRVAR